MRDTIIADPCGISTEDIIKIGEVVMQLTQLPPKEKNKKSKKEKKGKQRKSKSKKKYHSEDENESGK